MAPPSSDVRLRARGLSRRYGDRLAVADLDLDLEAGEVLGLLGPNGAGKSTTLAVLTGTLAPSSGAIEICGIDLLESPKAAKMHLGYLPERPPLYGELTVDRYLAFCARLHRVPRHAIPDRVAQAKARCGLLEVGSRLIDHLSKGLKQRVGIAQAIVHDPEVVVLDEPTAGLDPNQMREIRALVKNLGGNRAVIFSSHILSEVEAVCDRVLILHRGRRVFAGDIGELASLDARRTLRVELAGEVPESLVASLAALPGVLAVERSGPAALRIAHAPDGHLAPQVARLVLAQGAELAALCPETARLEDVFAELTRDEKGSEPASVSGDDTVPEVAP